MSRLVFYVNGKRTELDDFQPETTLSTYLRTSLALRGTKVACGEGGCGACTVMLSRVEPQGTCARRHIAVNACLVPLASVHGVAVTTVEGIGSTKRKLHPFQKILADSHGIQCGYCTPGIVMAAVTHLLNSNGQTTLGEMTAAIEGNLCRCTGYRPIIDACRQFCTSDGTSPQIEELVTNRSSSELEPIPKELEENHQKLCSENLEFRGSRVRWIRPTGMEELLKLKKKFPEAGFCAGYTNLGFDSFLLNYNKPVLLSTDAINELHTIESIEDKLKIGAAAKLSNIQIFLKRQQNAGKINMCYDALLDAFAVFGSAQIRAVATIGGNIGTASPSSDLIPILLTLRSDVALMTTNGETRKVKLDTIVSTKHQKAPVADDEILTSIFVPKINTGEFVKFYKQHVRKTCDPAIVNAAFFVRIEPESKQVAEFRATFGCMAETVRMASKTQEWISGKVWHEKTTVETAMKCLIDDLSLPDDAIGARIRYRQTTCLSFFVKFYLFVCSKLNIQPNWRNGYEWESAIRENPAREQFSTQVVQQPDPAQPRWDAVQRPIVSTHAYMSTTGEAEFTADLPHSTDELQAALVLTSIARGRVTSVDYSQARRAEGVADIVDWKDIKGDTSREAVGLDGFEVFLREEVRYWGQPIAAVLARTAEQARHAVSLVRVEYEQTAPPVVTTQQGIARGLVDGQFQPLRIELGSVEKIFANEELKIINGETASGGQEHFYLEPQAALVIPRDTDEFLVYASTQNHGMIQEMVSQALNVTANRVTVRTKRLGGGFGGKGPMSKLAACMAAVCAHKSGRPVRLVMDRRADMELTGGRHPAHTRYTVAFDGSGKLHGVRAHVYLNCGCNDGDESNLVALAVSVDLFAAYCVPNVCFEVTPVITNLCSNTAFRAFGNPQAVAIAETIMEHIASELEMDVRTVRSLNLSRKESICSWGGRRSDDCLHKCWVQCQVMSDYDNRQQLAEKFNATNRWKKRGVSMVPFAQRIGFPFRMDKARAIVSIYKDGSVQVRTGAVEMGQGVNTKLVQIVSRALQVPLDKIYMSETSTDNDTCATTSGGSACSDIWGSAAIRACEQLRSRLESIVQANPADTWETLVQRAYDARIDLMAIGWYEGEVGTDPRKPFKYQTSGAACSEVEIDCLTGDHRVIRVDIVMDVGQSLNPAIDVGQIEGAFMQGYGLHTLEDVRYDAEGQMQSKGAAGYKIPGLSDVPTQLNVAMLNSDSEVKTVVYSSKGIGEPPLLGGTAVLTALRHAIAAARRDDGHKTGGGYFRLDSPASCERIRMLCTDAVTRLVPDRDTTKNPHWVQV